MDSMRSLQTKMEWSLIWMNVIIMLVVHLKKKMKDHTALGALRRQLRRFQTETKKHHQFCIGAGCVLDKWSTR